MPSECRIAAGSRVRFNAAGLRWVTPNKAAPKRAIQVNWDIRIGTVHRISKDDTRAVVRWHGNKSYSDYLPIQFLELVTEVAHVAA